MTPRRPGHPVPGRRRRPGGQGHQLQGAARRRRPGRAGPDLRRRGRRRADLPRHLRLPRGPGDHDGDRVAHRRAGLHPADRRRGSRPSVEDVDRLLRAGADKVAVNTAAIHRPELVAEIADRFGNQVLVLSVDARRARRAPTVGLRGDHPRRPRSPPGSTRSSGRPARPSSGAGEILLNAMDADGTQDGFDLELIRAGTPRGHDPGDRLRRRRRASSTSRPRSRPARTPCSPPRSSTSARCGSPTSSGRWPTPATRSADRRQIPERRARVAARRMSGRAVDRRSSTMRRAPVRPKSEQHQLGRQAASRRPPVVARLAGRAGRRCRCAGSRTGTAGGRTSPAPPTLMQRAPELVDSVRWSSVARLPARLGAAEVLVVDEVLQRVAAAASTGGSAYGEQPAAVAQLLDQHREVAACRAFAMARSVSPASGGTTIPAAPSGLALADQQVDDQVLDVPVAAQGRGVGAELQGEVAEVAALALGSEEVMLDRTEHRCRRAAPVRLGGRPWRTGVPLSRA